MEVQIAKFKKPASIIGGLMLVFLGAYIAMATQMSIGSKDKPAKEIPTTTRVIMGVAILLIGGIIVFTHAKKQD